MSSQNPYRDPNGSARNDDNARSRENYTDMPDVDAALNEIVHVGAEIGSGVLGGIAGALQSVSDALRSRNLTNKDVPFAEWCRRLDKRLKNNEQDGYLGMAVGGWTFAAGFGIAALVMFILAMVGPEALSMVPEDHVVFPILAACFTPIAIGFSVMGVAGVRLWGRYNRLRSYLRAARGWVCSIPDLARESMQPENRVREELQKSIARGEIPGALISPDGKTLYLDDSRYTPPQPQTEPAPAPAEEVSEAEQLRREGVDFLNYLQVCRGKLDAGADEELAAMQKTCGAILGFAHNHPDQLTRLRRFREYYLPTTRKLLDTALGLGSADVEAADKIRGEITGILHTLNIAYTKLYETLLQDVSLDVSTEIGTLETMLRQDGLTHDFQQDFGEGKMNV